MNMNHYYDVFILSIITIFLFEPARAQQADNSDKDLSLERWNQFKERFSKRYSGTEDQKRRQQWESTSLYISQHNKEAALGQHTYTLGENQFSDWYSDEYKRVLGYRPKQQKVRRRRQITTTYYENPEVISTLPTSVNWTAEGWVNPVQNQGYCGSCWAFSACGALEAAWYNMTRTHPLAVLSEQNLIDCSVSEGNNGCDGGSTEQAFEYVWRNKGIDISASYPYTEKFNSLYSGQPPYGACKYDSADNAMTIAGWEDVESRNELALQQAVALTGPVSVAIDASLSSFQSYSGGVYSDSACSSNYLDHAVLAVGYGTYNSTDYWLLKNSWGVHWGINGYMMMARNDNNMCGISTDANFPIPLKAYNVSTDASNPSSSAIFSNPTLPPSFTPTLPANFSFPTSTARGYPVSFRNENSASERVVPDNVRFYIVHLLILALVIPL